ncbi:hypothetical protein HJC23_012646 [Cyclotella cryptica]|uniref:Uncharacterized protein n=1 Tax=Cyclotella cryptica TaxID=29204 RepID=A0ABD3QNP6_9STRA
MWQHSQPFQPPPIATITNNDSRSTVSQAYRSTEVRSPLHRRHNRLLRTGATTASKTMLAMRRKASRKHLQGRVVPGRLQKSIQKRLKKLQKQYSKTSAAVEWRTERSPEKRSDSKANCEKSSDPN